MREDLLCEVRGRVISRAGEPLPDRMVEFLPSRPFFVLDGETLCPIGVRTMTDGEGKFRVMLTRSDLTGIAYLTRGALGTYVIAMNGPGPHTASALIRAGRKVPAAAHDS